MRTFYATETQADQIDGETKSCQCDCGQSYAIMIDNTSQVIICDACYENLDYLSKFFN